MGKKLILTALAVLLLLGCAGACAEEIPEVGLEAALGRQQAFNDWLLQRSLEEAAAELNLPASSLLSPYGTDAPPEPKIEVQEGESWESLMARLLQKYDTGEANVGIGYYNTRTGEEHYISADRYLISASMFKIPLNMIYADRVSAGEMTMDSDIWGMPYEWYQYRTIVHSDNDRSVILMEYLGGYQAFKERQIPYLGDDPREILGYDYQIDNFYTPREFVHLLKMLYEQPERFPGIVENMLEAEPYRYFRQYEHRYPIAQKYGFVGQDNTPHQPGYHTYINTCGIVYTEDPFCLVVFTDNVLKAYDLIGEAAMILCDYTDMVSRQEDARQEQERLKQEASDSAAVEAAARQLRERLLEGENTVFPVPVASAGQGSTEGASKFSMSVISTIVAVWILIAAVAALVIIFRHNGAGKVNGFWAVIAIILAALGLILCVVGINFGTLVTRPTGDPQQTAASFFDAVVARDYPAAYSLLANYSSLGLEQTPSGDDALLFEALKESYGYTLLGKSDVDALQAKQRVAILHLNLKAIRNDASERVGSILQEIVNTRARTEVYDEDGNVLPAVADEIYTRALREALNGENRYYTSSEIVVPLVYRGGKWLIEADGDLLSALSGGI